MTDEDLQQLADKLDQLIDREGIEEIHVFTKSEVIEIQRVLVFVRRIDALGWWGKWLFYIVVTTGAIIANWERIVSFLKGDP